MNQEAVTTFTRRITNGNKSQIIVVLFDMVLVDLDDATEGLKNHEQEEYMEALRHANEVLEHLQNALDFKYDISKDLYSLYDYCKRAIAKSMYSGRDEGINEAREVIEPLAEAFREVAENDDSAPLMENAQKIAAGLTYGKTDVNEAVDTNDNRGFLA
ncbi:MAG: flagellar protein FliS [Lachnospiraceae bacterium]|nr:flagellar protein FliS [Lachnospiraceae bacterium]